MGGISDQDLAVDSKRFGGGNIPMASEDGPFADIHFEFNSSSVSSEYQEKLRQYAKTLVAEPALRVEVEGHCDKRGTSEYNLALGENRAKSVASMLVSFGVRGAQLSTISYGEEVPVDPADNESAYSKNRRAHFVVYQGNQGK